MRRSCLPTTSSGWLRSRLHKTFNPDPDEEDTADANVPVVDPTLDETRRILVDYINFLAKKSGVAASRPGGKGAASN